MPKISASCVGCGGMLEFVGAQVDAINVVIITGKCMECGHERSIPIVAFDFREYWYEGYAAFLATEDRNPYNKFDARWAVWEAGWTFARENRSGKRKGDVSCLR